MKNSPQITNKLFKSLAAGLLFTATVGLQAGGPLNLNPNDPDGVTRWASGGANIPYNIDQGGLGPLDSLAASALVNDAYATWQAVPTATATYSNNGQIPFDVDITNFAPFIDNLFNNQNNSDGLSPIVFDEDGSIFEALFGPGTGVLGFASQDTFDANGVPLEGVSFLNGGSILGGFPEDDFFGVMVHEFGHYSGMAHTIINGQMVTDGDTSGPTPNNTFGDFGAGDFSLVDRIETMYPFAIVGGGAKTLDSDDVGFFSFLYPTADFFANSGTITGTVFAPDGVTPLTGVNVIARNLADPIGDGQSGFSGDRAVNGVFTINGLKPGASYALFIDQVGPGGFSTPGIVLPGLEEFYNGANESNDPNIDDPAIFEAITLAAGEVFTADIIINQVGENQPLPIGDDASIEIFVPFEFKLCGTDYNSLHINSNGNLTFGAPNTDFSESVGEFLTGPARIAGAWDDLNPAAGGSVSFDISDDEKSVTVTWDQVPEFAATETNTFSITLYASRSFFGFSTGSKFKLEYADMALEDAITGFSCGSGVTSEFEESKDLSGLGYATKYLSFFKTALFETFTSANAFDLANDKVKFGGTSRFRDAFEHGYWNNNSLEKATYIHLPFDTRSVFRFSAISPAAADVDYYAFYAREASTLVATIRSSRVDTLIGLFDQNGSLLTVNDDLAPGVIRSKLQFEIPDTGLYYLAVSTFGDDDFDGVGGDNNPITGEGRYVLDINSFKGELLALGDDTSEEIVLPFDFPYQGELYSSVFVNSNGSLTFASGDTDFTQSVSEFLSGAPRIAPLWDDLSPNIDGLVVVRSNSYRADIRFANVPEFSFGPTVTFGNNFVVSLYKNGRISIRYGDLQSANGLAGITQGLGAADPGSIDLSSFYSLSNLDTSYEFFDSLNPVDLERDSIKFINSP